jgi:hypothetical protein
MKGERETKKNQKKNKTNIEQPQVLPNNNLNPKYSLPE